MATLWKIARSCATASSRRVRSRLAKVAAGRASRCKGKASLRARLLRCSKGGRLVARAKSCRQLPACGDEASDMEDVDDGSTVASPSDRWDAELALEEELAEPRKSVSQPVKDEDLVKGLGVALAKMVASGADTVGGTCFRASRVPTITIVDYLARIHKFFGCSGSCYVLALVYMDRLVKRHPGISISALSVHRLLLTSMTVAAKFFDDVYYRNSYYAKIGGLRCPELNSLEVEFMKLIDWKLHVPPEEHEAYCSLLVAASLGA